MSEYTMRIAICDDDAADLQTLAEMIRRVSVQERISCELLCYNSSRALLQAIERGVVFHTLMLDVVMPELNGMQLAAALRARQKQMSIVFVSSNREMAMLGYEVEASRFLSKPAQEDKVREALLYCYKAGNIRQELVLPTAKGVRRFSADEIVYIESWGRGVCIHMQDGQEEVSVKISDLEDVLPSRQFVLCHRAVIVNLAHVRYLRHCELELRTGEVLPVSKYRQSTIRDKLMNYLAG